MCERLEFDTVQGKVVSMAEEAPYVPPTREICRLNGKPKLWRKPTKCTIFSLFFVQRATKTSHVDCVSLSGLFSYLDTNAEHLANVLVFYFF